MAAETEQPRGFFFLLHTLKKRPIIFLHGCDRVEFRQVQAAQTCAFLNLSPAPRGEWFTVYSIHVAYLSVDDVWSRFQVR